MRTNKKAIRAVTPNNTKSPTYPFLFFIPPYYHIPPPNTRRYTPYKHAACSPATKGIPRRNVHFRVLCRKKSMPKNTPIPPPIDAKKKNTPSAIRSAFPFRASALSRPTKKNPIPFITVKYPEKIKSAYVIKKMFGGRILRPPKINESPGEEEVPGESSSANRVSVYLIAKYDSYPDMPSIKPENLGAVDLAPENPLSSFAP